VNALDLVGQASERPFEFAHATLERLSRRIVDAQRTRSITADTAVRPA
jgi:hypothetical protein